MTATPSPLSEAEAQALLLQLRRKEGNWVDWGHACQRLQQAGYEASAIFEETGIEGSQQNLVIVAAQVYDSLERAGATAALLAYYQGPRSDVLYELRLLNQAQRLAVGVLAWQQSLDADGGREVVKAVQEVARRTSLPEGFTTHPGDAVAFQCWQRARAQKDLQVRSRAIARGLKFSHSPGARAQIERLLSDFTVVAAKRAPLLPRYRLEAEEELPCIVPFAGTLPLTPASIQAIPSLSYAEPFRISRFEQPGAFVPLPGWQALLKAGDPVACQGQEQDLPGVEAATQEPVLIVVDRQAQTWDDHSYFLIATEDTVAIRWFPEPPSEPLLGQVIVVLRPKKILDEGNLLQPWQMDD